MERALEAFGISPDQCSSSLIGHGLINQTWKIDTENNSYILQRINKEVFKRPEDIAWNIQSIAAYLSGKEPGYLFVGALPTMEGTYFYEDDGGFFRLMPYVPDSVTIDTVEDADQAYEAARQFGRFTRLLSDFDASVLKVTLPDFHNLTLRFRQFEAAVAGADQDRLEQATALIRQSYEMRGIVDQYMEVVSKELIPRRVIHHDTKISNVLFDRNNKGLCVIDLDTVMPGYIISDLGDMMRTYLSPVNEECKDLSRIEVRSDFFDAIIRGYSSEMEEVLTEQERELLIYSGKFMIYMQAIRFLADFLNGDIYYSTSYAGQNLVRAENQFCLLKKYLEKEAEFVEALNTI